jgi:lipopolysaccharide transport system permease protein
VTARLSTSVVATSSDTPRLNILPRRGWPQLNLRELWAYRELLYFFVWRDIKVRYKQTVVGVAWAVIQPLLMMAAFSLFFGTLARLPSDGLPYPLFYFSALLPWMYFANALTDATNTMVQHQHVLTKVYFPRLILPLSAVLSGLVDLGIGLAVLVGMLLYYGIGLGWNALLVPGFLLLTVLTASAFGFWLSALNALYRDVRYVVPFLVQFWMFASPVAYPSSLVPESWRWLYGLNPMVGVIEGFRWSLLGQGRAPGLIFAVSIAAAGLVFLGGAFYFRKMEGTVADVV